MKKFIRQAEALEQLLGFCNQEGDSYQPSSEAMTGTALQSLLEESKNAIEAVRNTKVDLTDAINIRHHAYDSLPKLATRIIRALKAVKASPDLISDVNRIRQRFRYPSSGSIPDAAQENNPGEQSGQGSSGAIPSSKTPRGPISQLSFGMKQENFAELIGLLKKAPQYAPLENDLTIEGLEAKLGQLKSVHEAATTLAVSLRNAQKKCREMVCGEDGIYGIGMRVKDYYVSAFGFNDEKFKIVSKLKFVK